VDIYIRVRQYRLSKGMTQAWVAKQIGISPKTLNGIELGRQKLTAETLEAISKKAFGVEPSIFFNDEFLETKIIL